MRTISDHIMDIVQNSTRAEATKVEVSIDEREDTIILEVIDNGKGMEKALLEQATDPYCTSRTTRKVGLGLPLLKQSVEQSAGELKLESAPGVGTHLMARFGRHHIDRPPVGDVYVSMALLISGHPDVNFEFEYKYEGKSFSLTSIDVKEAIGDLDIRLPRVTSFLRDMIKENLIDIGVIFD